jgi:hypothetical protein
MAETLSVTMHASAQVTASLDSDLDLRVQANGLVDFLKAMAKGTGVDQIDGAVEVEVASLASGARSDVDLAGSLTDLFERACVFASIKGILFKNTSTNDVELSVGGGTNGAGAAAFDTWLKSAAGGGAGDGSECLRIPRGGFILLGNPEDGWAVTATSADILSVKNEHGSLAGSFQLFLLGVKA